MTLGLIVFTSFIKGNWTLFLFLILFAPGFGGGMTMRGALIREYFGTGSYGKIMGLTMGLGSLTSIVGPVLAGWVYDTFGRYQTLWYVYLGLCVLGILFLLGIRPLERE
jgi:MFS family permease